ncbi:hypothetical protein T492DRAFT_833772 [Pavlovales sp. CCMP2436]|nr:hypothetical protein T492DRAFT_833772 [Pavlovales sp. CCMP2436]
MFVVTCTAACAFPPAGLTDAGAPAGAPGLLPSAAGLPDWSAAGLPDWTAAGFPDWAAAAGLPDWRAAAGLASCLGGVSFGVLSDINELYKRTSSSELDSSPGPPAPSARMPPVPPASATAPPTAPPWAGAAGEGTSGERMARARLACACSPRAATTAAAVCYGGQRSSPSKLTSGDSPGIGIAGLAGLPTAPGLNTRAPGLGSGAGSASTRATADQTSEQLGQAWAWSAKSKIQQSSALATKNTKRDKASTMRAGADEGGEQRQNAACHDGRKTLRKVAGRCCRCYFRRCRTDELERAERRRERLSSHLRARHRPAQRSRLCVRVRGSLVTKPEQYQQRTNHRPGGGGIMDEMRGFVFSRRDEFLCAL